jgi:hypothetical protein
MKHLYKLILVFTILTSCGTDKKSDIQSSVKVELTDQFRIVGKNYTLYSDTCIDYFEDMFKEINLCEEGIKIIQILEFEPVNSVELRKEQGSFNGHYIYLLFEMKKDKKQFEQYYYYNLGTNLLIPLRVKDSNLNMDSIYSVLPPYKNVDFNCGSCPFSEITPDSNYGIWKISK